MEPTGKQINALKKLFNIGVRRGAAVLDSMLNARIQLEIPNLLVMSPKDLIGALEDFQNDRISAVEMDFKGKVTGTSHLVFLKNAASALVRALVGNESTESNYDEIRDGTLCEVGNIVLNAVLGSIANLLQLEFRYSIPSYTEENIESLLGAGQDDTDEKVLLARTCFKIDELHIEGEIVIFMKIKAIADLLKALDASNL
jgi:chemotaxis protein CheC